MILCYCNYILKALDTTIDHYRFNSRFCTEQNLTLSSRLELNNIAANLFLVSPNKIQIYFAYKKLIY